MEELTQLFICTAWRPSHRWTVDEDGLVEYEGQRVEPRYVYENFENDFPMFKIIRAEICKRTINPDPDSQRPYTWVEIERFDK